MRLINPGTISAIDKAPETGSMSKAPFIVRAKSSRPLYVSPNNSLRLLFPLGLSLALAQLSAQFLYVSALAASFLPEAVIKVPQYSVNIKSCANLAESGSSCFKPCNIDTAPLRSSVPKRVTVLLIASTNSCACLKLGID